MSSWNMAPMSASAQRFCPGANESVYPGSDGTTSVKSSRSSAMTFKNSSTDPGHPCESRSGMASGLRDRTWMKWTSMPSIEVVNCGRALSAVSVARQS